MPALSRWLDAQGHFTALPAKREPREAALRALLRPFAHGRFFTEQEVGQQLSAALRCWDAATVRRELCDRGLLCRAPDGSRYWRGDFPRALTQNAQLLMRPLRPGDEPTLCSIHRSLPEYDAITGEPFTPADAQALTASADLPPGGDAVFFHGWMVHTGEGEPAGYLVTYEGYPATDCLWIGSLFFHSRYHREGLGSAVVRAVAAQAAAADFSQMGLGVYAGNTRGLSFWLSQGFTRLEAVTPHPQGRAVLRLMRAL